jgi:lauroyl/myristoyl acyltransferase
VQYHAWRVATFVLARVPLSLAYRCASGAGWLAFMFWPRGRNATIRNFRHVFPGSPAPEVRRVARASFENYCCYLVDFIRFQPGRGETSAAGVEGVAAFDGLGRMRTDGRGTGMRGHPLPWSPGIDSRLSSIRSPTRG